MSVSRLSGMGSIGVERLGEAADNTHRPELLRLENLDTDLPLPPGVVEATRQAVGRDDANSYLPFLGNEGLRRAAAAHVSRLTGVDYPWYQSTIVTAGGLNGILNCLLALLEPGDEVILPSPIYRGLVNRVRLAGGVPVFAECRIEDGRWRLDHATLRAARSSRTKVLLMMSPVMPTGLVFGAEDWAVVREVCLAADAWLVYDAAMERILFDAVPYLHPAALPDMAARTITVGAVSKEFRMIGWRIGWIVAPTTIIDDLALVTMSNVVCPVGIAQDAATAALNAPLQDLAASVKTLERRRNKLCEECVGLPLIVPNGGWSALLDCAALGVAAPALSDALLALDVAATPMRGWGTPRSDDFLRFVFANESVARLTGLRERLDSALQSCK